MKSTKPYGAVSERATIIGVHIFFSVDSDISATVSVSPVIEAMLADIKLEKKVKLAVT